MQLSSDQFYGIIESLRSDNRGGKAVEKRQKPRVGLSGRATIKVEQNGKEQTVTIKVRDLSKSGIGFVHNQPMALDTYFTLCLGGESQQRREADVTYRVVSCRAFGDGFYAIGAKLRTAI